MRGTVGNPVNQENDSPQHKDGDAICPIIPGLFMLHKNSVTKNSSKQRSLKRLYLEGPLGLEPRTRGLRGRCSNQLSYGPTLG